MSSPYSKIDEKGQEKVTCWICGRFYHRLDVHVAKNHGVKIAEYSRQFPGEPTISPSAKAAASASARGKHARSRGYSISPGATPAPARPVFTAAISSPAPTAPAPAPTAPAFPNAPEPGIYKIGSGRLHLRTELSETDKLYVPEHNPFWTFDRRVLADWEAIAVGIEDRENIYISGPTGCGKSAGILEMAAVINQPVLRVQLTRDFKVSQFVGTMELKLDENGNRFTEFTHGVLPRAMKNGWWLLLDEVDMAHPDVSMALQSVLEGNPLVISENFGEVIRPHRDFRIIATANTLGRGDDSGLYPGAKQGNEATLDRYGVTIRADYPEEATEVKIVIARSGIDKTIAAKMTRIARNVREALDAQNCGCTFSTRRLIAWSKKTVRMGNIRHAAEITVLNKLSKEDREFVEGLIQRYFGGEV